MAIASTVGGVTSGLTGGPTSQEEMPGTLNQGWNYYFQWAEKNHEAWSTAFENAEANRRKEEELWREYYKKIYKSDYGFYKKVTMFALNTVQLWALWKQFRQQKELAEQTYEIANRVQQIAEELMAYYEQVYQPHETALGNQINNHFENGCIDYDSTAERFESNIRRSFARAKANALRCSSSYCGGFTPAMMKQWEIETAQAVGNARTGAYRYEEMRKETRDSYFLESRMKFIQVGRNVAAQGQGGIMKAFDTFSSFGADPGAALNQLLGTLSNTVGSMISSPTAPTGNATPVSDVHGVPFDFFFGGVQQNGDLYPAKQVKGIQRKG